MNNPTWPIVAGYLILSAITAGLYYLNFKSITNSKISEQMNQLNETVAKEMTAAQTGRLQIRDRLATLESTIAEIEQIKAELGNVKIAIGRR